MSQTRLARLTGLLILPLLVLGPFSLMWVPEQVHVAGDAAATAAALHTHAELFRWGLLGELGIAFTEVGMVVALHTLFRRSGPALSQAAAVAKLEVEQKEPKATVGTTGAAVGAAVPSQMLSPVPLHTKTSVFRLEIMQ